MNKEINYSFIIPHKNCPDLLQRCVDSIPERDDVQVIVVDDNSDEGKKPALRERKNQQVILLDASQSKGAGRARNVGLKHAEGKWLVFSDSDDFFDANLSNTLDKYLNDEHDIIYFNVQVCDCYDTAKIYPQKNKSRIINRYIETGNDLYLRLCYTEPWGKFIRHSLVTDNNIVFQETRAHNDLLFSVKTGLVANKVCAIDSPIYWYVIREGSLRTSIRVESYETTCDRIRAWDSTQHLLAEYDIKTKIYLPLISCVRYAKSDMRKYFRLLNFMRHKKMHYLYVIRDTIRYYVLTLLGRGINLNFENIIIMEEK